MSIDETLEYLTDFSIYSPYQEAIDKVSAYIEQMQADYEAQLKADMVAILDKIRAEIMDCLKALDEIEKSGLNIYLPNEMTGRRLTYQQCLEFIDKYKAEVEPQAEKEQTNGT